jgi:hypothetical protein
MWMAPKNSTATLQQLYLPNSSPEHWMVASLIVSLCRRCGWWPSTIGCCPPMSSGTLFRWISRTMVLKPADQLDSVKFFAHHPEKPLSAQVVRG